MASVLEQAWAIILHFNLWYKTPFVCEKKYKLCNIIISYLPVEFFEQGKESN